MLVLTRRYDEKIYIDHCGERLTIVVMDMKTKVIEGEGGKREVLHKVRIGLDGPRSFVCNRSEVVERMEAGEEDHDRADSGD